MVKMPALFNSDAFAAFDGEGIFFSQSEHDFFEIVSHAKEIVTHT
jgi:hypothetical protein